VRAVMLTKSQLVMLPYGSARLGSARLGSARLGAARGTGMTHPVAVAGWVACAVRA
jgi:hypothetical protein